MRLWTLHPSYLDRQGLVALWREALLARAVLRGETRGYRNHPQLQRFRAHAAPLSAIEAYLCAVYAESLARGYVFDRSKIEPVCAVTPIPVSNGQLAHEWAHLMAKLRQRSPQLHRQWQACKQPACHPLFRLEPGPVADWERGGAIET